METLIHIGLMVKETAKLAQRLKLLKQYICRKATHKDRDRAAAQSPSVDQNGVSNSVLEPLPSGENDCKLDVKAQSDLRLLKVLESGAEGVRVEPEVSSSGDAAVAWADPLSHKNGPTPSFGSVSDPRNASLSQSSKVAIIEPCKELTNGFEGALAPIAEVGAGLGSNLDRTVDEKALKLESGREQARDRLDQLGLPSMAAQGTEVSLQGCNAKVCMHSNGDTSSLSGEAAPPARSLDEFLFASQTYLLRQKYGRLGKTLGVGASGRVRLLYNEREGNYFAVKEFFVRQQGVESERSYLNRLFTEYAVLSNLHHMNIISVYDFIFEKSSNRAYQVMEFCAGGDCFSAVFESRGCSVEEINCTFKQLIQGLCYLHSCGIVHRDLKLENLVFDAQGCVKICDFGSLEVVQKSGDFVARRSNLMRGSLPYVAPEVFTVSMNCELAKAESESASKYRKHSRGQRQQRSLSNRLSGVGTHFGDLVSSEMGENGKLRSMPLSSSYSGMLLDGHSSEMVSAAVPHVDEHRIWEDANHSERLGHDGKVAIDGLFGVFHGGSYGRRLDDSSSTHKRTGSGSQYHSDLHTKQAEATNRRIHLAETDAPQRCKLGRLLDFDARKADVWACGIIFVAMRSQRFPWKQADPKFDPAYAQFTQLGHSALFDRFDKGTKEILYKILNPIPEQRPTSIDLWNSRFITQLDCCHLDSALADCLSLSNQSTGEFNSKEDSSSIYDGATTTGSTHASESLYQKRAHRPKHRHHGIRAKVAMMESMLQTHSAMAAQVNCGN